MSSTRAYSLPQRQSYTFFDDFMYVVTGKLVWIPFYAFLIFLMQRRFGWKRTGIALIGIALTILMADPDMQPRDSPYVCRLRPSNPDNPISQFITLVHGVKRWPIRIPLDATGPTQPHSATLPDNAIPHKGNGSNDDFMDAAAELFQSIYGSALPHRYPRRLVGRFILRHDYMVARLPIRKLPSRENGASTTRPRLPILHKIMKLLQLNKSGRPPKGVSGQIF